MKWALRFWIVTMTMAIPSGFRFAGVHCGIKSDVDKEDLVLVVADKEVTAAGVYTQNRICAPPVVVDRQRTPSDRVRVVVVNSGNANACTGERGLSDAQQMARWAAGICQAEEEQALVMSTGIIGEFLPMERIQRGIQAAAADLANDEAHFLKAARGILTTDQYPKVAGRAVAGDDHQIRLAGFAKGAGMIGPRMATMLAVLLTDAALAPPEAQRLLAEAVDASFNCISVEGHTSTNDTVLLLASGEAGTMSPPIRRQFRDQLQQLCVELAKQIPADGEGAEHLITIRVRGADSRAGALQIARTVADSPLVKTAIAGADPNWGRIVSAVGYAGVEFAPEQLQLDLNGTRLYQRGMPASYDEAAVSRGLRDSREALIELQVGSGPGEVTFWTSDLTVEYVRFNSDYHT